ncbi:MAG TPA: hypothetical protein VIL46_16220 [Gemmataceae bacterium]
MPGRRLPGGGRLWVACAASVLIHSTLAGVLLIRSAGRDADRPRRSTVSLTLVVPEPTPPRAVHVDPPPPPPPPPSEAASPPDPIPDPEPALPERAVRDAERGTENAVSAPHPALRVPSSTPVPLLHQPALPGQTVVYVLDCSASMGLAGRLDRARECLLATLRLHSADVRFQVITYHRTAAATLLSGSLRPVPITPPVLAELEAALADLTAGGSSAHAAALRQALLLRPDAVFWLTDADDLTPQQVGEITARNRGRAVIHTVRFAPAGEADRPKPELEALARANGGTASLIPVGGQ